MEISEKPYTTSARCGIMHLDDRSIAAIEAALDKGYRVEISPDRDGNIKLRTVHRKDIKVDTVPTA